MGHPVFVEFIMKYCYVLLCFLVFTTITPTECLVAGIVAAVATYPTLCETTYVLCCAAAGAASGRLAIILAQTACGTAKGICYAACYGSGAVAPA